MCPEEHLLAGFVRKGNAGHMIGLGCLGVPIDQVTVAAPEVAALLKFEEGRFLDLKAIEVAPSKLTKGLSAFANADGGELYVGVDETANGLVWRGFNDQEDANGHLQIFEELFPLGSEFSYEFLVSDGQSGCVLHITVQKTREIKYASDGKAYVRRGAQSLPATTPEALDRPSRGQRIDII